MSVRAQCGLLLVALLASCAPVAAAGAEQDLKAELSDVTDAWRERVPVPAVTLAVETPDLPPTVVASGATPDARFRIASITKTFVATVVLQLVEEGRLELDDPLSAFADLPGTEGITIRHLLGHTSGLPDYGLSAGIGERLLEDREHRWTSAEVLALVADRDRDFAPGTAYGYSNTNYVALGEVIERVTGTSWAQQVRHRVIDPAGLHDTFVAGSEDWRGGLVSGSFDTDNDGVTDSVGDGPWPSLETSEGPAGAIVSTAADVARFARALFEGDLLGPASLATMTEVGPHHLRHYGYGLGVEIFKPNYETTVWGHGGSLPGYRSSMWYLPSDGTVIVVLTNEWRSNPADLAELVLQRLARR
jgi:D-alanyl-D-alanine carboxypeptidase